MQKITIFACATLDTLPHSCYNTSNSNRKAQLMTTFDEQFNNDLPGEINDDFSWILPDGETIEDHIPDFYSDDEDLYSDDPGTTEELEDDSFEDDSWTDADSLASAGWGTDEDYGLWE